MKRASRRDIGAALVLVFIAVGAPLFLAAAAGTIGVPALDDWVYTRGALSLFRTGAMEMPGHSAASIGQIAMVQPLLWLSGGDARSFAAFGLAMTVVGVAATYGLARQFVGVGSSVMVVLLIEVFPGFIREGATFMTDVPAYAVAMASLLLGTMWLRSGRRHLLVGSLAAGLLAVNIREFAFAAPAAIVVASWASSRAGHRSWLAWATGLFLVALVGSLAIAATIPGRAPTPPPNLRGIFLVPPTLVTLAAVVLPATALGISRRMATLTSSQFALGAGVACVAVVVPWASATGNAWMQRGLGADLLLAGARDPVFGDGIWALSAQVALFSAILLAALVFRWAEDRLAQVGSLRETYAHTIAGLAKPGGLLLTFLLLYFAEVVAFAPIFIYDRYLFPMVPPLAILLLAGPTRPWVFGRRLAFAHGAFAWLAASAFIIAANSFAYDGARWREGTLATVAGYDPLTVDAGYEWIGFHAGPGGDPSSPANDMTWNGERWSLMHPCAVLSNSPQDDAALTLIHVDRAAYREYLVFGSEKSLYLYGVDRAGCPTPMAGRGAG